MPAASDFILEHLAKQSFDSSFIISHLIRQIDTDGAEVKSDAASLEILKSILDFDKLGESPLLKANRITNDPGQPCFREGYEHPPVVCLTESTLMGLKSHRDTFHVKFGLAFARSFIISRSGNPCININELLFSEVQDELPHALRPFVRIIRYANREFYDSSREKEWRIVNDFRFKVSSVQFIFCPTSEFSSFSVYQNRGLPVLFDLEWLDLL